MLKNKDLATCGFQEYFRHTHQNVMESGSFRLVCKTQQQQLNFYQFSSYHTVQVTYMYKAETI